jgi:hypothetical protein
MLMGALGYADCGWFVHPVRGKRPYLNEWQKQASVDAYQLKEWWVRYPNANVAIVTGLVSKLLVLDVDNKNGLVGKATLRQLEGQWGHLPATLTVQTPHGLHFYFEHPGGTIRNSVSRLGDGIDVRCDGGYVVAPPSKVGGRVYEWLT